MGNEINFEALDRSDMETAAAFVESIAAIAQLACGGDVSENDMRDIFYVIGESLSVAGAILSAGVQNGVSSKPQVKCKAPREEVA